MARQLAGRPAHRQTGGLLDKYKGRLRDSSRVRQRYSPSTPSINICTPLTISTTTFNDAHPSMTRADPSECDDEDRVDEPTRSDEHSSVGHKRIGMNENETNASAEPLQLLG